MAFVLLFLSWLLVYHFDWYSGSYLQLFIWSIQTCKIFFTSYTSILVECISFTLDSCIYYMCVQPQPYDYSVQLYQSFKRALDEGISSRVSLYRFSNFFLFWLCLYLQESTIDLGKKYIWVYKFMLLLQVQFWSWKKKVQFLSWKKSTVDII